MDAYISKYRPDWLYRLVMRDPAPLQLGDARRAVYQRAVALGIVFFHAGVRPGDPRPVLPDAVCSDHQVLIATLFGFVLRVARRHYGSAG